MYKIKDKIDLTVKIVKIYKCPDTNPFKVHSSVLMEDDKKNEFTWNTTTDKYPIEGVHQLKATISDNSVATHNWECKAYYVSNCKFSKPNK